MSKRLSNIKNAVHKTRLEVGLRVHEEAYRKVGIDMGDELLQEILYREFWDVGFQLLNIDPQDIIKEYNLKSSKLWKLLNG